MNETAMQDSSQGSPPDRIRSQPGLSERRLQARYLPAPEGRVPARSKLHDLCETCDSTLRTLISPSYKMTPEEKASGGLISYHPSVRAMLASSASGCALCRLIMECEDFDHYLDGKSSSSQNSPLYLGCRPYIRDPDPALTYSRLSHLGLASSAEMERSRSEYRWAYPECYYRVSFVPCCEPVKSFNHDVSRVAPMALATSWLEHCRRNHPDCRTVHGVKPPTRLIDVSTEGHPKLVLLGEEVLYAALSHCWGKLEHRSCLTSENVNSYLNEIPFDNLELNFQDAIVAARGIGYRYLWIDVLCIIQDDTADWQKECARMEDVYANADLVLAATWAPDSTAGFLVRNIPGEQVCDIPLFLSDGFQVGSLYIRLSPPVVSGGDQVPLNFRAWAYQEKRLARRFLSFGRYHMTYMCLCGSQREADPYPYEVAPDTSVPCYIPGLVWPENPHSQLVPSFEFGRIINQYTHLLLSREDDRLPALSGIAKRFHNHTGDQYLAGLWRNDLVVGLAWRVESFGLTELPRSAIRVSPSWSWATRNVVVSYDWQFQAFGRLREQKFRAKDMRIWTEVVNAHVELAGLDPFGKVTGGQLTLLSRVCRLSIGPRRAELGIGYHVLGCSLLVYWPDDPPDPRLLQSGFEVVTLPLCSTYNDGGDLFLYMLVLEISNEQPLQYRRSGLIYGCLSNSGDDYLQADELLTKFKSTDPRLIHIV